VSLYPLPPTPYTPTLPTPILYPIYIHTHTHIHTYIHTYIHTQRGWRRRRRRRRRTASEGGKQHKPVQNKRGEHRRINQGAGPRRKARADAPATGTAQQRGCIGDGGSSLNSIYTSCNRYSKLNPEVKTASLLFLHILLYLTCGTSTYKRQYKGPYKGPYKETWHTSGRCTHTHAHTHTHTHTTHTHDTHTHTHMPDADANMGERTKSLTNDHLSATQPVTRGDRASALLRTKHSKHDDDGARISDRSCSNIPGASEDTESITRISDRESITRISDRSSSNILRDFGRGAAQIIIPDPDGIFDI